LLSATAAKLPAVARIDKLSQISKHPIIGGFRESDYPIEWQETPRLAPRWLLKAFRVPTLQIAINPAEQIHSPAGSS
jgi:hypothetical protein